jgi:hypothetical protein
MSLLDLPNELLLSIAGHLKCVSSVNDLFVREVACIFCLTRTYTNNTFKQATIQLSLGLYIMDSAILF